VPEEEEETAQAKVDGGSAPPFSPSLESGISSIRGGGQPLSESTRSFFEPCFGADFSSFRVHNDSNASQLASSINAKAFTFRKDVVFGSGQHEPETSEGKKLMAHELTHVVQQTGNSRNADIVSPSPDPGNPSIGNTGKYLGNHAVQRLLLSKTDDLEAVRKNLAELWKEMGSKQEAATTARYKSTFTATCDVAIWIK
jgi:hypothetical protein